MPKRLKYIKHNQIVKYKVNIMYKHWEVRLNNQKEKKNIKITFQK